VPSRGGGTRDIVISTGGMSRFAKETPAREIIVGTEPGIHPPPQEGSSDKIFHPVSGSSPART